jgi:hypothetical protein
MTCKDTVQAAAISRRRILWGGAFAACGAVAATAAVWPAPALAAPKKMPQSAVAYQARPKSGAYCLHCSVFQTPDQCGLVEGPVSPNGWCSLFTAK